MARADKQAAVAALADQFRDAQGAVLTEYRGLSVRQLQDLRRALADDAEYAVVKNTLTRLAAQDAGAELVNQWLSGPSAIAFITGDAVSAAKGLRDFARANPALVIKGGLLDGRALSASEIAQLADLESREVLLARLAGAFQASLANTAALLAAPLSQVARLAEALRQQRAEEVGPPGADGAAAEPPEAVAEPPEVTADPAPTT